ncbi:hypothetical protein ACR78F_00190 [Sphingobacterium spiritivorum]|uniref:hypothetical protein n=1 Tax=Sphingobacterium spiritivorum TaxID=258 RepID=UPI003DA4784B
MTESVNYFYFCLKCFLDMINKIALALLLLIAPQVILAQAEDSATVEKHIRVFFAKADKKNLSNVIPYIIDGKTGFIDAKTKKIILKPTDKISEVSLFNPIMTGKYGSEFKFSVSQNGNVRIEHVIPLENMLAMEVPDRDKIELISAKTGYKGFKVDKNGKLIAYSDLYHAQSYHFFNVQPFLHKGQYYAIVTKKTGPDEYYDGIIDTAGNTLAQFNFKHHGIDKIDFLSNEDDIWFSTPIRNFKGSLISFNGHVKLKDELVGSLYNHAFNYNLNSNLNHSKTGILDLNSLTWVIKPQSKYEIINIAYTSSISVNDKSAEDRKNVRILFEVKEGNKTYFIDLKQQKYLPKM